MCYNTKKLSDLRKFIRKYQLKSSEGISEEDMDGEEVSGFTFPMLPVITDKEPTTLEVGRWWLMREWQTEWDPKAYLCLNTRVENAEKPNSVCNLYQENKALLPVAGFYETQKNDVYGKPNPQGKHNRKHEIKFSDEEVMFLACIYSDWFDKELEKQVSTISILTRPANQVLADVHNAKERMPVILDYTLGQEWLAGKLPIADFETKMSSYFESLKLDIQDLSGNPRQGSLF